MSELRSDPHDLSARVRRGDASRAEERALARLVESDPVAREAHEVGLLLDRETAVQAGDEELILRAADQALLRLHAPQRKARPRAMLLAAAVVLAVVSVSGVGAALWAAGLLPRLTAVQPAQPSAPAKQATRRRAPVEREPVAVAKVSEPTEPSEVVEVVAAPTEPVRPARRAPRVDPAELFRDANAARRAGELKRALQLYGELIRKLPESDEAHVARVSLGKLLFSQGHYREAEQAFRRYLREGGGPLSEEALFHRAESLGKLGRSADERQAWQALLAGYPHSVYAARARDRQKALLEVESGQATE
ncbi:MAG TPA: tetratricopeptide repeat protein [Polyangiales bacterium]